VEQGEDRAKQVYQDALHAATPARNAPLSPGVHPCLLPHLSRPPVLQPPSPRPIVPMSRAPRSLCLESMKGVTTMNLETSCCSCGTMSLRTVRIAGVRCATSCFVPLPTSRRIAILRT
jgi:hypothetical protein